MPREARISPVVGQKTDDVVDRRNLTDNSSRTDISDNRNSHENNCGNSAMILAHSLHLKQLVIAEAP